MKLYHSTSKHIRNQFKIIGNCGYGVYFARTKRDSMTFGDLTYKVDIKPINTLVINDNDIKNYNFFNITLDSYKNYIKKYDSLQWNKNGKLKEFVVLDISIIKNKTII